MSAMSVYDDMIVTLEKGKINIANFNTVSRKTLQQLFEEIVYRDVILLFDEATGRVIRVAISASILIEVPRYRCLFLETGRRFSTGKSVHVVKESTISETAKIGEDVVLAAVRGLKEELGLHVSPYELQYLFQDIREYPSTAYVGVWSHTLLYRYLLRLPALPWPEEFKEFSDNGTTICVRRYST